MDIASLIAPFVPAPGLTSSQLQQVETYLDLLLRWNQKTNLTSVRGADEIITRHFGESFFLAASVFQETAPGQTNVTGAESDAATKSAVTSDFVDIGSGAGFPGIPIKIYAPQLRGTLVESQNRKATFLKEVVRNLKLKDLEVFNGRAEKLAPTGGPRFSLVTLRAVECFEQVLSVAAQLLATEGRLALLIGASQVETARRLLPMIDWQPALELPLSRSRVVLVGKAQD